MKKWVFLIALVLLLPRILAINVQVEKTSENEVLIADIGQPVVFDLQIKNNGAPGNFEFYNLAGFSMEPSTFSLGSGETKNIRLTMNPIGQISQRGYYTVPYYVRASDTSEIREEATFKIIDLKDAFEVGSGDVDPDSQSIQIYIKNLESVDFGQVNIMFSSAFFNIEKTLPLESKEIQRFSVQLSKEDFKSLMAGFYTLTAELTALEHDAVVEGVIRFVEKDILTATKKDYGFLINTQIITKTNEGNTIATSETVIKKNIVSRLFTTFAPTPDIVERQGFSVYYTWSKEIPPGESLEIEVRTNWLFPLILVLLIVAIVVFVKKYTGTALVMRKKVTFVRAKGGEFALKVSIATQAKKHVERVNVIDRLPPIVSLHEKFLGDQPTRTDEKNRRLEWNFDSMQPGEIRLVSYIIYSRVGVFGKFELPIATAIFEHDGEIHEVESNKAFFVSEQRKVEE